MKNSRNLWLFLVSALCLVSTVAMSGEKNQTNRLRPIPSENNIFLRVHKDLWQEQSRQ